MGSIFGTYICSISIPQMFATKAMTGNATSFRSYEYSKILELRAVDAVLDPANLQGLDCLLRKIFFLD
jgi:hypothetical protein